MKTHVIPMNGTIVSRRVTVANSLVDGCTTNLGFWNCLNFVSAYTDDGPGPTGNDGPCLTVSNPKEGTTHRVCSKISKGDLISFKGSARNFYVMSVFPRRDLRDERTWTWNYTLAVTHKHSGINARVAT